MTAARRQGRGGPTIVVDEDRPDLVPRAWLEAEQARRASAEYELGELRRSFEASDRLMPALGLTRSEARFLGVLALRGEISREGMEIALYGAGTRDLKILDVWLCKVRRKVPALAIETIAGWGWRIEGDSRTRLVATMEGRAA